MHQFPKPDLCDTLTASVLTLLLPQKVKQLKDKKKHKAVIKDKRKKGLLPEKKEEPKDEEWEDEEEVEGSEDEDEDEDGDNGFFDVEAEESEDDEFEGEELGAVSPDSIGCYSTTAITDITRPRPHQQQHS